MNIVLFANLSKSVVLIMKKQFFLFLFCSPLLVSAVNSSLPASLPTQQLAEKNSNDLVYFSPPLGWKIADSKLLPKSVKIMVIGESPSIFPPSMNLSIEPYQGSLKQYLKLIKNMDEARGNEWKDLGSIRTEAGTGSLSQVDEPSQWGVKRLMRVILLKNNTIYILTASALKNEFAQFYDQFFNAMRSLRVAKDALEMVSNTQQRTQLRLAAQKLKTQWQELLARQQQQEPELELNALKEKTFQENEFQQNYWIPFQELLNQKYADLGSEWQTLFLTKVKDDLYATNL
jgi:hypothetical protein